MKALELIACSPRVDDALALRAIRGAASYLGATPAVSLAGAFAPDTRRALLSSPAAISEEPPSCPENDRIRIYLSVEPNPDWPDQRFDGPSPCIHLVERQRFHPLNQAAVEWMRSPQKHPFFASNSSPDRLPEQLERFHFFPYGYLYRDEKVGPINDLGFRIFRPLDRPSLRERADSKLVCLFGGSAAFSINCFPHEMLSHRLELALNERAKQRNESVQFVVLNFAQHAHVVLNELQTYQLFAQALEPDLVIAHDGYNDLLYGAYSDPHLLQNYGLTYHIHMERWAELLAGRAAERESALPENLSILNYPSDIVASYQRRKRQFRNCVQADGCPFLSGLQPVIAHKPKLTAWEAAQALPHLRNYPLREAAERMEFLYEQHRAQLSDEERERELTFFDLLEAGADRSLFTDFVHTTPECDQRLADAYADRIMEQRLWKS